MTPPNGAPAFQPVTPSPVPFSLSSGVIDGTLNNLPAKLCLMDWRTPVGSFVLMCGPDEMETFGKQLIACARQAKSGIVLLPGMPMPPLG